MYLEFMIIGLKRTLEEEKAHKKEMEELDRRYQERMDRRGEITSFANRW